MGSEATAAEQFGPYVVYERLGIGGMATVHRAVERAHVEGFERVVALKRLLPHLAEDATFIKAFVREAKLAALLTHANIGQIYDLGRVDTQYFISMEYIDGCDLRRILRHARSINTPPPVHVTVGVMLQLCDALEYAHNKTDDAGAPLGLVHRDVSPSNLLLTTSGHLKVIDFGIAKAQSLQLRTQTGRVKGKLAYMAPEAVLASQELDARSDLWAVGVILHELLTARPLFWSKNEYQTLIKIEQGDILPPSILNPNCPPALDSIVIKALARDMNQRFTSAADIRNELMRVRRDNKLATTERDIAQWLGPSLASLLLAKASSSPRLQPHPTQPASRPVPIENPGPAGVRPSSPVGDFQGSSGISKGHSAPDDPGKSLTRDQGVRRWIDPLAPEQRAIPTEMPVVDSPGESDRQPGLGQSVTNANRNDPNASPAATMRSAPLQTQTDGEELRSIHDPGSVGGDSDSAWGTEPADHAVVLDDVPDVATGSASPALGTIAPPPLAFRSENTDSRSASAGGEAVRTGYQQAVRFSTFFPKPAASSARQTPVPHSVRLWVTQTIGRIASREPVSPRRIQPWWLALGFGVIATAVAAFTLFAVTTGSPASQATRPTTHGTIEIAVEPSDAIIKIGQQTHTGSPWTIELPAGTYDVAVDRLNYHPWQASVDLSLGEQQRFRLTLQPSSTKDDPADADAALAITTIPPGLELIVDGHVQNQRTPVKIAIPPGDHVIVLRQAGIERWWQGFRALPASSYEFSPVFSTTTP